MELRVCSALRWSSVQTQRSITPRFEEAALMDASAPNSTRVKLIQGGNLRSTPSSIRRSSAQPPSAGASGISPYAVLPACRDPLRSCPQHPGKASCAYQRAHIHPERRRVKPQASGREQPPDGRSHRHQQSRARCQRQQLDRSACSAPHERPRNARQEHRVINPRMPRR